jgi:hypothetical protein
MNKIDRSLIDKRYVNDILEYYINEIYSMHIQPVRSELLVSVLEGRIKDVLMGKFIIDYTINVHLSDKQNKRDEIISYLFDENSQPEYFIEVAYRMTDKSFNSVKINENLLNSYGINNL